VYVQAAKRGNLVLRGEPDLEEAVKRDQPGASGGAIAFLSTFEMSPGLGREAGISDKRVQRGQQKFNPVGAGGGGPVQIAASGQTSERASVWSGLQRLSMSARLRPGSPDEKKGGQPGADGGSDTSALTVTQWFVHLKDRAQRTIKRGREQGK